MHEHALRKELVRYSHLVYERNLLVSMDGNLSVRLASGLFLCTRAGCHKGFVTEDDLVVVDRKGALVRGHGRPTSELLMHIACYEERPDVNAILHTHPPYAIAFTLADRSLERLVLPEVVLTLGTVPTIPYETTGTQALADALRPYVRTRDVVMMDRHGAVALGKDLHEAFCKLETLEHTARIVLAANSLGGVKELPADESVRLRSMGLKRYGGPPQSVAMADAPRADLPKLSFEPSDAPYPEPAALLPRVSGDEHLLGQSDAVRALARALVRDHAPLRAPARAPEA
jgi:L-fuculose-phosphate aldolase